MNRTLLAVTLSVLAVGAAPARAQIPGIGDAARVLDRVPSLSSFLEGDPPITTSLDDARTEIAFLDGWSPSSWQRLDALPRTGAGAFRLRPGRYAMEAQSYCMHAGTHGPGGGDGYLYAPLEGPKADIVQSLLRNSVSHPEIPQRDIQVLLWAIIARTEFDEMPSEMKRTARALLTRDQIDDLDDGALGMVPESVMREAMNRLPPVAQQVFLAEARLRSMISSGTSNFAELERVAVLTGAVEPPEGSRPVPSGRWSFDPNGYFVRYDPSGYSQTRVEVSVPRPVAIARDASGRIVGVYSAGGRLESGSEGVRFALAGVEAEETVLPSMPASSGEPGGTVAQVLAHVLGSDRPSSAALRDLADLESLGRALRAAGVAVGEGDPAPGGSDGGRSARADAFDLVAEAWQASFCVAAGCPGFDAGEDVLILRGGESLRGELQGCAAESCMFGYTSFERDAIEWIGLNRPDPIPPAAVHADVGEVHRIEGVVRAGDLLGVGQLRVVTDRGGHDRPDVAWIHLVPGEEERAQEPPVGGPGADDPPEPPRQDVDPPEPPRNDEDEEPEDEVGDAPIFDPSDDVATPGNRGRQRLAQSSRPSESPDGPPAGPEDDRCAGERRALHQAEALLELHDLQMQSIEDRYSTLYDQLSEMKQEFDQLHAAAEQEWSSFQNDVLFQALQNILGAFLPIPPDQGSIAAAQSVIGFYDFYTANTGTIADMRQWAQANSGAHDLNDLLRMLDHMDAMYRTMGRMTQLKHEYDEMEVNREPLEDSVEEARRLLEECMGAVG
ncbi:MAG TPA: hypothetical protein VMR66_10970 [Gemmatimonadota bacterium]|nr:hypothetical protein [Gemmatimonadota bacterium]